MNWLRELLVVLGGVFEMTLEMKSPRWVITWTDDPKAADILGADDLAFYQPDDIERAIAEAVAAEREKVELEMGTFVKKIMDEYPDWTLSQLATALKEQKAIRSAAK